MKSQTTQNTAQRQTTQNAAQRQTTQNAAQRQTTQNAAPQRQTTQNAAPRRQTPRHSGALKQTAQDVTLRDTHRYDDIIDLPHHVSTRHPQMSPENRAAQFSPFSALTGHAAAIEETARPVETFVELDENRKEQLNEQLLLLTENLSGQPEITVTYFKPDSRKEGGAYVTMRGRVKSIDLYERQIRFADGKAALFDDLYALENLTW